MSSAPIEKPALRCMRKKESEGWPLRKCESSIVETFSLMANSSTRRMDNTNTVEIVFWRTPFVNPLTLMRVVHYFLLVQSWPLSR